MAMVCDAGARAPKPSPRKAAETRRSTGPSTIEKRTKPIAKERNPGYTVKSGPLWSNTYPTSGRVTTMISAKTIKKRLV